MPEVRRDNYQTPEQRRAVEECLNLYSKERKKQIEEWRRGQLKFDELGHKNSIDKIIDLL